MALTPGLRVGAYEIQSSLGAGGMGEVYRATDMNLKRPVAIKVLPEAVATDAERLARFQREAEILARLNHPNIAQIHGLEKSDSTTALVMELVEGPTLADRIAQGPIPLDEALPIARQVAEALEAAHEQGIIHRDLKPANIKARPDGVVKVLDFGLAKAFEPAAAESSVPSLANSPTVTSPALMTSVGTLLGTAAYMSPEQAKGRPADKRSDNWGFGCVLYEALAGKRAFEGNDVSDMLAAVLRDEPDWNALPAEVPESVRSLIRGCLTKDRRQRIGDISTALFVLRNQFGPSARLSPQSKRSFLPAAALLAAAVLLAIAGGIVMLNIDRMPSAIPVVRFPLPLPPATTFLRTAAHLIAISPDGRKIAYIANRQLFLRQMSEMEARPIAGAAGDIGTPFFSPDGEWVGFFSFSDSLLKRIAVTGGAAVPICKATAVFGAHWYGDDIVFEEPGAGIMRVSVRGGDPAVLASVKAEEGTASSPRLIDAGKAVLFTLAPPGGAERWERAQTIVQSLDTGQRAVVLSGASDAWYVPSGHLAYAAGPNILSVPFDLKTRQVKGGAVPVIENVMRAAVVSGNAQLSIADNGAIVYIPAIAVGGALRRTLALVDRTGKIEALPLPPRGYEFPRVSPDGKQLAFAINDGKTQDIHIYGMSSGAPARRITLDEKSSLPLWNGNDRLIYASSTGLFRLAADGLSAPERLTETQPGVFHSPSSIDPSGKTLAFTVNRTAEQGDTWVVSLDAPHKSSPLMADPPTYQTDAVFSPDGKWIAYSFSDGRSLGRQIFVRPYPALNVRQQITSDGGAEPLWSSDGKQLFFVRYSISSVATSRNSTLNVVDIRTDPGISPGTPVPLPVLQGPQPSLARARSYDIMPNGQQFVVVAPPPKDEGNTDPTLQINVVLNWFTELQQRVPTR